LGLADVVSPLPLAAAVAAGAVTAHLPVAYALAPVTLKKTNPPFRWAPVIPAELLNELKVMFKN
jgi:hypothetical protein